MAEEKKPGGSHMSAATARRALLAVAVGAVVAAVATIYITGGFRNDSDLQVQSPGAKTTGAVAGEAFGTADTGVCLNWDKPDFSDLSQVDCGQPHKFEVAESIDLSNYPSREFGPGSRFPDSIRLAEINSEICAPAVKQYLGARFDPDGRFFISVINPGEKGWAEGERTIRCGLEQPGKVAGTRFPITGRVKDQDQSRVYQPGTCLGVDDAGQATDPSDCAKPHAIEVVAEVDLGPVFTGGPPAEADQDKFLDSHCIKATADYLGSPTAVTDKTLTPFYGTIDSVSWLAGSRKVNCMVGKGENERFAPIEGSAKGDILINGQKPVPPPKLPEGRSLPTPLPGAAPVPGLPPR